jgi:sporulation related protein
MRAVNAVLVGFLVLSVATGATAQSLRNSKGPAELPPASYTPREYVDSKGCVYVRAGYGGVVQWVPRVTRKRKVVCGMKPSVVAGAAPARQVQQSRPQVTAAPVVTAAPAQVAAQTRTVTRPRRNNIGWFLFGAPRNATTTVRPVQAPVPAPVAVPPRQTRVVAAAPVARYKRGAERTVPQPVHPADYFNGRLGGRALGALSGPVQVTRTQPVVPQGYVSLLADPTAIPRRGVGTPQGQAQMDLIWTQTMPRRLIDVTTGRDVTATLPQIRYPYTAAVSSRAYLPGGQVMAAARAVGASNPHVPHKKLIRRDEASPSNMQPVIIEEVEKIEDTSAQAPDRTPVPTISVSVPAAYRFIQVATFGVPANARRTLARFSTSGLPAVSRPLNRGGKTYAVVMLGPFRDDTALKQALSAARGAGFSDAFYVR